jgi:hypothetical protein
VSPCRPHLARRDAASDLGGPTPTQGDNRLKARFLHKLLSPFSELAASHHHGHHGHASHGGGAQAAAAPPKAPARASSGGLPDAAAAAASSGGAPDADLLSFCAHAAAALPFRRADEPLLLLHHISDAARRHAGGAAERLRAALLRAGLRERLLAAGRGALDEEDLILEEEGSGAQAAAAWQGVADGEQQEQEQHQHQRARANCGGAPALPPSGDLAAAARAALGVATLLVLKQFLMAAYWLSEERVAAFAPKGERKRAEEKAVVARNPKVRRSARPGGLGGLGSRVGAGTAAV